MNPSGWAAGAGGLPKGSPRSADSTRSLTSGANVAVSTAPCMVSPASPPRRTTSARTSSHWHLRGLPASLDGVELLARGAVRAARVLHGELGELTEGGVLVQCAVAQRRVPDRPGRVPRVPAQRDRSDVERVVGDARVDVDVTIRYVAVHVGRDLKST